MARITVRVRGLPQARAAHLAALANIEAGTEKALEEVADDTLDLAKDQCPVGTPESTGDPDYEGGTLKESLQVYKARLTRQVGTDLYYGPYVHEGTRYMTGRPFLTTAFEARQSRLVPTCLHIRIIE